MAPPHRQLSHGFFLETFGNAFASTALQPLITGPLFAALLWSRWSPTLPSGRRLNPAPIIAALGAFASTGLLYRLNNFLSRASLNNWVKDSSWDWSKEVVVVTGGCSGIGKEIAVQLAQQGVKVVVLDVSPPEETLPSNVHYFKTDVTSSEEIAKVAVAIRETVGHPTVLVNNAGIGYCKPILQETEDQVRRTFEVNNVAHFLLVKEFAPYMIEKNHGHIITIASLASFMAFASNVDYGCTKAAALAFHEGLAQELKYRYNADKVRTTVVHPTWVRTPLIERKTKEAGWNEVTLDPKVLASIVVAQILRGESAQLIVPGRYNLVPSVRGAPSWLAEGMRNSGADILRE